ncbi:aromatic acid exporter family protein [Agrilactobacillus fermenti]|uniref:aromatic acid exporter family protein n=1 Tax=Agrilactobacillus fermenti TaxID=2586909 RepID=UPI001E56D6E8|nr:aromatic acid exporter family protein [Agrilactobacillus fermenti]MCD2255134.1 aromatic acid exporter family protein [Agrilactobacillus fermenti]
MRIGLRTIKTAVGAAIAILLAYYLHLQYWPTAGIITVLSVQNTTKASFRLVFFRIISTAIAFLIAVVSFRLLGYNAIAFGIFLLLFIPVADLFSLQDGIVLSAVLVTVFLIERSTSLYWLMNQTLLMVVGAGVAIIANLFMPNLEDRISTYQDSVEQSMQQILQLMSQQLQTPAAGDEREALIQESWENMSDLKIALNDGMAWTARHNENQLLSENDYYKAYFEMRNNQYELLRQMQTSIERIDNPLIQGREIAILLQATAENISASNAAEDLVSDVEALQEKFESSDLPKNRAEFEVRAQLYYLLSNFHQFLRLKNTFYTIVASQN